MCQILDIINIKHVPNIRNTKTLAKWGEDEYLHDIFGHK